MACTHLSSTLKHAIFVSSFDELFGDRVITLERIKMALELTIKPDDIRLLCDRVEAAQEGAYAIHKLTDDYPSMTIDDGYAVQAELRQRYLAKGHRLAGWKAGLTSKAKMEQMGVHVPSIGFLTDKMARTETVGIKTSEMVHPRVECEVAFMTKKDLQGPDCTLQDVLDATDYVLPAVEIIDSRFSGFKFDLASVVADNGSSARYVTGKVRLNPRDLDLTKVGVVMKKNGEVVASGESSAVLGHPAEAIAMLVNILAEQDEMLPAGSFVMSGGITEAIPVQAGDAITAEFQILGQVSMTFVA
ncbi:MAG: 2-oxo-3-hexenedioate decarboxylase [Pseudomonadota bacterium]